MPLLVLLLLCAVFASPVGARAAGSVGPPVAAPASLTTPPPGFSINANRALAIAAGTPAVKKLLAAHPKAAGVPNVWANERWEVDFDQGARRYASVDVSADGRVEHVWTGLAASSYLLRGTFDKSFSRWWVWVPFGVLFLVPFVDPRRLRRLLHLDLLVLLSFGISFALFNGGRAETAVMWFYPPLAYLLVRLLFAGLRPARPRGRLVPVLPTAALLVGVVALFGARVALNIDSNRVMDIGYASVVGADRIAHKEQLYVDNDAHGDTYGPVNYIAYIPFELALPFKGEWDDLPAAHAATLFFDLMTLLGLFLLGRGMRAGPEGRRLGLGLAWAWAAFPFTLLGVMENTNDGLVAMLLVWMLVAFRSTAGRGAILGLAAATKFFPGGLLLVIARGDGEGGRRGWLRCGAACVGVFAFSLLIYFPAGGVRELWNCTLGYQLSRDPDLSFWAVHTGLGWTQTALQAFAVLLALVVAVVPGRRTIGQVAALAGAIAIALQLPAGHWFYFYILWFTPLALVALFAEHRDVRVAAAAEPVRDQPSAPPLALAS
jgi:hypothetical protein